MDWLSQGGADPQVMLAWMDSFPIYAQFGWGLGVWMGLIGSVLLLMRHRWAVPAYALSLLGALLGLGYQILRSPAPAPPGGSGCNGTRTAQPSAAAVADARVDGRVEQVRHQIDQDDRGRDEQ